MIALIIAVMLAGWEPPCFVIPAIATPDGYRMGLVFSQSDPGWTGWTVWSNRPVSVIAPVPLTIGLALPYTITDEAYITTASSDTYTIYLCAPEERPGAVWMPIFRG